MRDLYRCLDEYTTQLLSAIAEAWHVTLPKGEPRELVLRLGEAMLTPGTLEGAIQELPPLAREALAEIVREGGAAPGHRLLLNYGTVRRFGPAKIAREQPWLKPQGPLEELFYRGLIYRAYGTVGSYYGEIFLVPQQILERMPALPSASFQCAAELEGSPTHMKQDGRALAEDLFSVLVRARQGRVRSLQHDLGSGTSSPAMDELELGPRLMGEASAERLALMARLLWRLHLLQQSHNALHPSPRAREWLRLTDLRRMRSIYLAWRDDPHWHDLHHVPALRCEDKSCQDNPVAARMTLLAMLARCSAGVWLALDSFVQTLKRLRPDYLRPDGDYDTWAIRDAQSGESLRGLAFWERIEGALAAHLLVRPLRWLGVVDVGYDDAEQPIAFRLTELGRELLAEPAEGLEAEAGPPKALALIQDDFSVVIPLENTLYERYQLERFADWQAQDAQGTRILDARSATYQISAESIWRSHNAGVKSDQIMRFLRRISGDRVAPAVMRALTAWGGRFGRAVIRKMVILRTVDEQTMQQIHSRPDLRALLGETLSPTSCVVNEEHLEALIERLKALGIWPLLRI